jgi:hypothetical protein
MCYIHLYRHDYSIHTEWLGRICRRFPGNDRTCRFSDERYRSVFRIVLFAEAGFGKSITRYQPKSRHRCTGYIPVDTR